MQKGNKYNWQSSIWLLLFLCISSNTIASSYYSSAQSISASDGLPETTIFSMAYDKEGFIWLGTPSRLIRYDGYEFKSFSNAKQESKPLVVSNMGNIFIDSHNRLWIGSWGEGIAVYSTDLVLLHYFQEDKTNVRSLPNNRIQVIFEDKNKTIWLGTNGGGLARFDESSTDFTVFENDPNDNNTLSHNRVWSIAEDKNGAIWVATSKGLNKLPLHSQFFETFYYDSNSNTSLNHDLIRSLLVDKKGRLWVGTQTGFGEFDVDKHVFERIELLNQSGTSTVSRIKEDRNGSLFIGTLEGLYRYIPDKQQLTPWSGDKKYQLFPQNDIRDILFDRSGLLWVATRFGGLIKVDLTPNIFKHIDSYTIDSALKPIRRVYALFQDSNNIVWISTADGLLTMDLQTNLVTSHLTKEKNYQGNITSISEDKEGTLWLSGSFGLLTLDKARATFANRNDVLEGIQNKNVNKVFVDSHNHLWVGMTHGGLIFYDFSGIRNVYRYDKNNLHSLNDNTILSLFEDRAEHIWAGTPVGLNRFDSVNNIFSHYDSNLTDYLINDITQTNDGAIWLATPASLNKFDYISGNIQRLSVSHGLSNDNIKGVLEDDFGNLWVSSSHGISKYNMGEESFINYSATRSFNNNTFLPDIALKATNGTMYFGGINGIDKITPARVSPSSYKPNTVITDVWVDDKKIFIDNQSPNRTIKLPHDTLRIEIAFATLDFFEPSKIQYSYILNGLNDEWRQPSTSRIATFTSLDPGVYIFSMMGINSHNIKSQNISALKIIIATPWWETLWVKLLMSITVIFLFYKLYQYRVKRYELQKDKLERKVSNRTEELKKSNLQLASTVKQLHTFQKELVEKEKMATLGKMVAGVAHEVNTPIGIGITASTLLHEKMDDLQAAYENQKVTKSKIEKFLFEGNENIGLLCRSLDRASKLINKFQQVDIEQSNKNVTQLHLYHLITEMISPFQSNGSKHEFIIDCDKNMLITSKRESIEHVLSNLIENSLGHGFEGIEKGTIMIECTFSENSCTIMYSDNGNGVSEEFQKVIFDPFSTTNRGSGSGLGMHLVYNIVAQALHGSIEIHNNQGSGIKFKIEFPMLDV
ncbi:hypothetical protein A3Q34_18385 [Colwellia sp. PAMC 20917]|uniref:sensor histidine kinase n=1 Tax=Colwellia sp. PAMC 20917 TaxID=1816218 RepID=UPI000878C279|nr:two-component regulator propeller domain-containing protein [Colwellia sp. PAMC 20917]AOW78631.1 hypothetical protein A3Q34_18385 [Colwellia sp. PAMC 20917]